MNFARVFRVRPGARVNLSRVDPGRSHGHHDPMEVDRKRDECVARMAALTRKMWADNRHSLLIVLQGMDTCGKDGTIRRVFSGINPQGCRVTSFKRPSDEELDHDFLWRIHNACPRQGEVGIFNRSHYEDVGVVRVHRLVPRKVWSARYDQINAFERHLADNGTVILKFFLHISKAEQKRRLLARLDDPEKNWKMSPADFEERRLWRAYMLAYSEAITRCGTRHAPWYIIPSDHKWFRNLAVACIVAATLEKMDLRYPKVKFDRKAMKID